MNFFFFFFFFRLGRDILFNIIKLITYMYNFYDTLRKKIEIIHDE